jgi:hypothetical protein
VLSLGLAVAVATPAVPAQEPKAEQSGEAKGDSPKRPPAPSKPEAAAKPPVPAKPETSPASPFLKATTGDRLPETDKTYTNEDLERLFGPSPAPAPEVASPEGMVEGAAPPEGAGTPAVPPAEGATGGSGASGSPLDELEAMHKREAERQEQMTRAEKKVADIESRIAELEKRARSVSNPFLPRTEPPKEGREEWDKMTGEERAARTQEEITAAREELEQARRELDTLRSQVP